MAYVRQWLTKKEPLINGSQANYDSNFISNEKCDPRHSYKVVQN